jgi:hypothetical protein
MATTVVKVVIAIMVALGRATIAVAMVAVAMVAVGIEGLGIATTDITLRTWVVEIAASVISGTATFASAAAWPATHVRTATAAFRQSATAATGSTTHVRTATAGATTAMGNGRTAAAAAAHAAAAGTTSSTASASTAATAATALVGDKSDAVTGRVDGGRRGRGLRGSPYEWCHC